MTLRVSGKNLAIGESLRQHVLDKVETVVGRYFDGAVSGHVVIAPEGSGYRSDCTLHLSSGATLLAEGKAQEPYQCFDQAADRIERRLRRYKRRLKERHAADGAQAGDGGEALVVNYMIEAPDEDVEESGEFAPVIVAEGSARLKSLSVASAVMELDLTGAPLVVFLHAGSARVNIVYRRRDGAIGWLDPQEPSAPKMQGSRPPDSR
ncbi:MAG TPA: ribosome-associated translation inhibitor RaiA [Roseiarcus sp.]|nr:ribosome-associated translation inhibitor RaiA [Roseiarcus sp.]